MHAVAEAGQAGRVRFVPGGPEQRTHRLPAKPAAPGAVDEDVATHGGILRADGLARTEGDLALHIARRVVVADHIVLAVTGRFAAADTCSRIPDDLCEMAADRTGVA